MVTANLQKTSETKSKSVNYEVVGGRKNVIRKEDNIVKTSTFSIQFFYNVYTFHVRFSMLYHFEHFQNLCVICEHLFAT